MFHRSLTSQNHEYVLDVCSVPATDMRQNQPQVDGRTHTTNTPRQDTHGQHWMSARAMSAHFFTSLHPCFTQSGTYDGVGKQGLVRHSQPLLRPVHESHHSQYIDRKTRRSPCRWSHTGRCDGQPQTVPTRFALTHVFHYVRCFIYTRTTGSECIATCRNSDNTLFFRRRSAISVRKCALGRGGAHGPRGTPGALGSNGGTSYRHGAWAHGGRAFLRHA